MKIEIFSPACEQLFLNQDSQTINPRALGHASVITDPPYGEHVHARMVSCAQKGAAKGVRHRDAGFDSLSPKLRDYIVDAVAAAKRWGVIYCDIQGPGAWEAQINETIERPKGAHIRTIPIAEGLDINGDGVVLPDAEAFGYTDGGTVGQYKWIRWSSPQQSGDRPCSGSEWVVLAHVPGPMVWGGPGNLTALTHKAERGDEKHPTAKPLDQALDLVAWHTNPGDLVYDPTGGRATLGVACVLLGRNYVGCDTDATHAARGAERIARARAGDLSPRDAERFQRWTSTLCGHHERLIDSSIPGGDANQTCSAKWLRRLRAEPLEFTDCEWLQMANSTPFTKGIPFA